MKRFRAEYGTGPVHLLAVLASFAIAAYAIGRILELLGEPSRWFIWFGGAILAHDLVLYPLYALLGLVAYRGLGSPAPRERVRVAALNHLRVPALLSGLALLVFFPLILSKAPANYENATALDADVYLERWLALSAVLFAGSALLFALRVRGLSSRHPTDRR